MTNQWMTRTKQLIEGRLQELLPPEDELPQRLHSAMRYSVLAGGKRLRGMLLVAAGEACDAQRDLLLSGAAAVEFFHTYTLIHDDLPAMDDDDLRRGKPTNHKVYGEAMAILAGDALQALSYQVLANLAPITGAETAARMVAELASAGGSRGVVGGQAADIMHQDRQGTLEDLEFIHNHKTGDLITVSLRIGGLLGNASPALLSQLTGFARAIGLAFQIVDDLLDITGSDDQLGKDAGSDNRQGKLTYPCLLGIEESKARANVLYGRAMQHLDSINADTSILHLLAEKIINRSN